MVVNDLGDLPINRQIISGLVNNGNIELIFSEEDLKNIVVFKKTDGDVKQAFLLVTHDFKQPARLDVISRLRSKDYVMLKANETTKEHPIYITDPVLIELAYGTVGNKTSKSEAKNNFINLIQEASRRGVSDIHITLTDVKGKVWFGENKILEPYGVELYTRDMLHAMISSMYNTEADSSSKGKGDFSTNIMQEAKIDVATQDGNIEIRYQSIPIVGNNGTKITLRVLAGNNVTTTSLEQLGYADTQVNLIRQALSRKNGLNLVVGETGSGKTTTAHVMINELLALSEGIAVHSIEDPPEIINQKIFQSPLIVKDGETKQDASIKALGALLRSAPSIIFLGEIRSKEQAEVAAEAVLTGHGMITTLHTQGAIETILRLLKLDVDELTLGSRSFLNSITYQALLGKSCQKCSFPLDEDRDAKIIKSLSRVIELKGGVLKEELDKVRVRNKDGCVSCKRGVKGKLLTAEVMVFDDKSKQLIRETNITDLEKYWKYKQNLGSLAGEYKGKDFFDHAMAHVLNGLLCPYDLQGRIGSFELEIINLESSQG